MFTGFASENTPAIQVWDFFRPYTGTARVSLADDCAPIQIIRTGGNTTAIQLYLPSAPIEGKQIKIVNTIFGSSAQQIFLYASDVSSLGTLVEILNIGAGQTVDICYSKNLISFGSVSGYVATGWVTLNSAPASSANHYAVVLAGSGNKATQPYSAVIGGSGNTASASYASVFCSQNSTVNNIRATVIGGSGHTASADLAAVVGGGTNTASGSSAAVVGGSSNTASGTSAAVVGGETSAASGTYSAILGGSFNTANATNASVVGGQSNTANSNSGIVAGGRSGTTRLIQGNTVLPASAAPINATTGVQQLATLLLGRQTTDATATVLTSNTSAASTTNQVILPNNSAYTFQGTCIANVTAGGTTSGWKFEGVIKRGANAASTALVAAVTPLVIAQDAGAVTWVLAITADTTNGGIKVEVTGAAATTIRWVTKIETTEVTF